MPDWSVSFIDFKPVNGVPSSDYTLLWQSLKGLELIDIAEGRAHSLLRCLTLLKLSLI